MAIGSSDRTTAIPNAARPSIVAREPNAFSRLAHSLQYGTWKLRVTRERPYDCIFEVVRVVCCGAPQLAHVAGVLKLMLFSTTSTPGAALGAGPVAAAAPGWGPPWIGAPMM